MKITHELEPEIEICPKCCMVSMASNLFVCHYCGFVESTAGQLGYWQPRILNRLRLLGLSLNQAINYQLPKSTISDHLKDCFGWLAYKPKIVHRLSQYSRAMINMFADKVPVSTPLFAITDGAGPFVNGEEIEIDIIRGDQRANDRH